MSALAAGTVTQAELGLAARRRARSRPETGCDRRADGARRPAAEAPERDDARHDDAREGGAAHRRHRVSSDSATRPPGSAWSAAAVFPEFGDTGRLGNGVFLTYVGLKNGCCPTRNRTCSSCGSEDGVDVAANVRHLRRALDPVPTRDTGRPRELQELEDVTGLPTVLGALLAFLAAATLAHTLLELGAPTTARARGARSAGLRPPTGAGSRSCGRRRRWCRWRC